jgi:hypothetical protein
MESTDTPLESPRRVTRIRLQLPIRLTVMDPARQYSDSAQTLVVNPQGCGLRFSQPLPPGTQVLLDYLPYGHEVTGSVVNCVPLGTGAKFWVIGICFDQPRNVWGIPNPPADWASDNDAEPESRPQVDRLEEFVGKGKPVWEK